MASKPVKIEGDIMWAFLDTPNDMSGKYQVDICNLSPADIKSLESVGINVRNKEGKGFFITAKSTNYPIKAVDAAGNPITVKVANGSRGKALINPYSWSYGAKSGVNAGISELHVTNLIEYNPANTADNVL
jgi:hypothetical protein